MSSWAPSATLRNLVNSLLNRFLAPYVENLNTDQLNISLWSGEVVLKGLKLKKEALDKFRLPVDVTEGHLGTLSLTIPYSALGTKPVRVIVEDVFLLAVPNGETKTDQAEDERRAQAAKQERLDGAEALDIKSQVSGQGDAETKKNESVMATMIGNIINNLQITVKNIHVRYEDKLSTPDHPFAAGLTLAEFKAVSTDENWVEAFIHDAKAALHKMAKLSNLAIYFDTDAGSIAAPRREQTLQNFSQLISRAGDDASKLKDHQYILKPVTGEGRIIMNRQIDKDTPQIDAQVLFDEFGFVVDDDQYRDTLSMVDLFHFYNRTQQYRRFRPPEAILATNPARERLKFALNAIRSEVHEKNRKWSWEYFAERRDDRKAYVKLFMKSKTASGGLAGSDLEDFDQLERKLTYEDIRFYRSIAKSELRKDAAMRRKLEEEKKASAPAQAVGWIGWAFGSKKHEESTDQPNDESMTDADRKGLLSLVGYDPDAADLQPSPDAPKDALKMRVTAKLKTGSFALRQDPHGKALDIVAVVWDAFQADVVQLTGSFDATVTLGGFRVYDGTTQGSVYPQIVRVKEELSRVEKRSNSLPEEGEIVAEEIEMETDVENPFLSVRFENNPLDGRADNAATVKMRHLEIIYHKGYVENVVKFFRPPESQLESISALMDVASETLDGIRKETRAGLEFALQQHRTIDIKLDMNAPIIIIPENITTKACQHIVLDAGHIAIESDLVAKEAMAQIEAKKAEQYSDEDFKKLESLMYDRFTVRLESAQLLMGKDLETCLSALDSDETSEEVHVLERINMSFLVQNAILNAPNLTRFKIEGNLPVLQVNFSDTKYKTLMRFIDVAIPKFGDDQAPSPPKPAVKHRPTSRGGFLQRPNVQEYNLEEHESEVGGDDSRDDDNDTFFEAPEISSDTSDVHQRIFEFKFGVEKFQASVFKSQPNGKADVHLADALLEGFGLDFGLKKFDMSVDLSLRSVSLAMIENGQRSRPLVSSDLSGDTPGAADHDLVRLKYSKVQKDSPEFQTVWEGVDQTIAVELSTFNFTVAPVPVLSLYDFIMTTFVPKGDAPPLPLPTPNRLEIKPEGAEDLSDAASPSSDKIRIRVKLTRARILLQEGSTRLATLAMSAGEVSMLLRGPTMRIAATLGDLSLTDDSVLLVQEESFKKLLSVEGDDVVDFSYETFDPTDHGTFPGYNSAVFLRAGSLKLNFMERPMRGIYQFAMLFSRLQPLYDSTSQVVSQAAVQRASELQKERMHFDIIVKTPIIVFPRDEASSKDVLVTRLGEIIARNTYDGGALGENRIAAGLHGIKVTSEFWHEGELSTLQMISDVSLTFDVTQNQVDRGVDFVQPDTKVIGKLSDVKVALTQSQYCLVMDLVQSIPRVLDSNEPLDELDSILPTPPASTGDPSPEPSAPTAEGIDTPAVDLGPELGNVARGENGEIIRIWKTLDLAFSVSSLSLELFDAEATDQASLKEKSIASFALISTRVNFKMLSDGAMDAEVMLKDITMMNTRVGESKWREIIPLNEHNGDQLMIHYTTSGGVESSALAIVTIDSPKVILAVDPLYALVDFATSAFPPAEVVADEQNILNEEPAADSPASSASALAFRVEIVNSTIMVLENDTDSETQAIQLSVDQLLVSHQGVLALNIQKIGMSLFRMDKPDETVRFLDPIDITLSLDSRQQQAHQKTDIELNVQPIIFRSSYRDIMLITEIVNKAIALASRSTAEPVVQSESAVADGSTLHPTTAASKRRRSSRVSVSSPTRTRARRSTVSRAPETKKPLVVLRKEHLKATIEGFQLILIGDLQELPLLHLFTQSFSATVNDWSGDMKFITAMRPAIKYYNLTNSAWEPLLEPWDFMLRVARNEAGGEENGKLAASLSSKQRLELNVTATFIELAITSYTQWTKESERILQGSRGGDAPYLVRNRTGYPIHVWADKRSGKSATDKTALEDGAEVHWRFEDYKTLREHIGEANHHALNVEIHNADWEQIKHISVDREGEFDHALRPRLDKNPHRLICDIKLVNNVKIVTLRSPLRVINDTHVPVELVIIEKNGKANSAVYKIAPGEDCPLPIEAAYHKRFKLRPDPGFEFAWSTESLHWEDLRSRPKRAIACRSHDTKQAAFRFQASSIIASTETKKRYPQLTLSLRAPIEIENLLPYDIKYRVFDKNTSLNSSIFLRKGGISPVHQVELSHLLLLSVQVQDTDLKPSEFAIINTDNPDDFSIEDTLVLTDRQGLKLNLKINYSKYPDDSGAFKVQVYAPYIFLNKTGLPLAIRSKTFMGQQRDVAGSARLADDHLNDQPTPFMFSFANTDRRNKCFIKYGDSAWSKPLSFETIAADTEVLVDSANGRQNVHTGLSYVEGLGKYKLTKVITLSPRFMFKNNLGTTLNFRQESSDSFVHLLPGERAPLHRFNKRSGDPTPRVVIAHQGSNQSWSAPVNITEIGRVHVTLARDGHQTPELIRVEVHIDGPIIFVSFSEETERWPFRIQNDTDLDFEFCQTDAPPSDGINDSPRKSRTRQKLTAHSSAKYTWELPAESGKRLKLISCGKERLVDVMEIGVLKPFKFSSESHPGQVVSLDVRADGPSQLLVLSKYEAASNAFKPTSRGSLSRTNTIDSNIAFEAVATDTSVNMTLNLELEGIGISVLNKKMHELVYITFRRLELHYVDTVSSYSASIDCKWIQIDNQLFGGLYPIILYPTNIPKDGKELEAHPTLQASVIVLKDEAHGVMYIKYASILLQAMTVELDEDFAFSIYDFSLFKGAAWQSVTEDVLIEHPNGIPEPAPPAGGPPVYFESLALQPIQLELSFMRTEHVNVDEKQRSSRNPVFFVLNALTMALGNVNAAPVRLNALLVENVRLSIPALQSRVVLHYTNQFTAQLYRILGSADAFGNPVGLFTNVSSGVHDIFYEPYQGFVLHGNKDLASGIARGATSFVKKTVFGVTDSISKVTGSIGKGISAATLDPEYQARRRQSQRRNKPRHALYGLAAGAQAFGSSVASGLEGVVLKPLEGAESGGAGGFFKGVGKGLVGIVTKPVVGVFDFASTASQGIRNTTTVFDNNTIDRIRLPRFVAGDGILRPYSGREALGQSWLKDLEDGKYASDVYVAHIDFADEDSCFMLTTSKIIKIRSSKLRVLWVIPFYELTKLSLETEGISLTVVGERAGPFIPLSEQGSKLWFFQQLRKTVTTWNERKVASE